MMVGIRIDPHRHPLMAWWAKMNYPKWILGYLTVAPRHTEGCLTIDHHPETGICKGWWPLLNCQTSPDVKGNPFFFPFIFFLKKFTYRENSCSQLFKYLLRGVFLRNTEKSSAPIWIKRGAATYYSLVCWAVVFSFFNRLLLARFFFITRRKPSGVNLHRSWTTSNWIRKIHLIWEAGLVVTDNMGYV